MKQRRRRKGCMECSDWDCTFDFKQRIPIWHLTLTNGCETFSQPHPSNRLCWLVIQGEGLVSFKWPVLGGLERRWALPSFPLQANWKSMVEMQRSNKGEKKKVASKGWWRSSEHQHQLPCCVFRNFRLHQRINRNITGDISTYWFLIYCTCSNL